jgi:glycosyltransferase involved in cell wall biosynthesis
MTPLVFLDYFFTFGGAQRSTATLLNRLHDVGGKDCIFVAPSPPAPAFGEFLRAELICLFQEHRPELEHSGARPLAFARALGGVVSRLDRLLRSRNLERAIFVTSSPKGLLTLTLYRLLVRRSAIIAYYCRGEGKAEQFGRLGRFLTTRFASRILCVSEETARNMTGWGVLPERVRVVYTSIDVGPLLEQGSRVRPAGEGDGPIDILFAASLIPTKGLHHLLGGLAMVRSRRPVRLRIAGDIPNPGHAAYRCQCRRLAGELPANIEVEWLGWLENVPAAMISADIVCLPTYTEGFPRLVVEAMALRRVVVAHRVGGIRELVRDGETGFVIPLHEAGIAGVLDDVFARKDLAAVADAGRKLIVERYALATQVASVVKALEDIRP